MRALRIWICNPVTRAAVSTPLTVDSVAGLAELTRTAMRVALGTSSRSRSSRFAPTSPLKKLIPVRLPPGRAMLATRPTLTGSSVVVKTIGIVEVASLAAKADLCVPKTQTRT